MPVLLQSFEVFLCKVRKKGIGSVRIVHNPEDVLEHNDHKQDTYVGSVSVVMLGYYLVVIPQHRVGCG